ncbi:MAG TPA: fibronectin type III domain-containing protein [Acidobacteriota bacterium]|nr:fibronectin type III domain-containing protein [Acidobacteriota bacterium]
MKTRIVLVLLCSLALLRAAGCDRHIESRDPVRSLPPPTATPSNVSILVNGQAVVLGWEVSDSTGIDRFRIYRSEDSEEEFEVVDSTTGYSITVTGLAMNREYFFRVASVTAGGVEGPRSETVSARTGLLSISIEGGDKYTNSRDVSVHLISIAVTTHVALSEDSTFADSAFSAYAPVVPFQVSDGDGAKTVYARYTFANGARSGDPVRDDIILDTRAQMESVTFSPLSGLFSAGDTITFFLDAGEAEGDASVSIAGAGTVQLANNGRDADVSEADSVFTGSYVVPPNLTLADGEVTGVFRDAAGNTAPQVTSPDRLNIASTPVPVQLTVVEAFSSFEISLVWTRATGSGFAAYRLVRDTVPILTDSSVLVSSITSIGTTAYADNTLRDSTRYYYAVYVRDNLGRDTASNVMSAVTLANDPPAPVVLAGSLEPDGTTALLTWSSSTEHDFESYRVYRDTTELVSPLDQMVGYISHISTTTFSDYIPVSLDSAFYRVYVYDRHGASAGSEVVRIIK